MPDDLSAYGPLAAIALLIAASVWLGTLAQKVVERGSFMKGYFLGNRGLGSWALALTATVQSGGTFMGFPSIVYTNGWVVAVWISAYMVVPLSGFAVLAKRFAQLSRRVGAVTIPDLFRERFASPTAGLVSSLLILFFMTFMMVAQFKAGALIIKVAWPGSGAMAIVEDASPYRIDERTIEGLRRDDTPDDVLAALAPLAGRGFASELDLGEALDNVFTADQAVAYKQIVLERAKQLDWLYLTGLVVFTLAVVGYTLIGGFLAAVWTDLFQSVIMWIGVMLLLPLALFAAGGLGEATSRIAAEVNEKRVTLSDDLVEDARLRKQILAERQPAVRQLRELDQALREHAEAHEGRLPDGLAALGAADDEGPLGIDPLSGGELRYFGEGRTIDPRGSTRRVVLAVTPPQRHEADADNGWQSVLYSNGVIRSGVYSEPGDLVTAPGPFGFFPLWVAFSYFFIWVYNGLGSPAGMVRVMACKDTRTIRRSIFLLGSYNLCIYVPLIVICICGRSLLPDLGSAHSDEIVPQMALLTTRGYWGGAAIAGLILAAPFGAVMATVSSYLVVIASGLVRDVYQRFVNPEASQTRLKRLSYAAMVIVGAIGVAANVDPIDFLQQIVIFSGTCGATSFVVPAVMTAYWRRATAAGAISAMLCGAGTTLALYTVNWVTKGDFGPWQPLDLDPIVWGLAASLLAGVVVSLLTRPPAAEHVSRLFDEVKPEIA